MKAKLIHHLYNDSSLRTLAERLCGGLADDLIQEVGLAICEKSEQECEKLEQYFNFWCVRVMMNMCSNGKFKKIYEDTYLDWSELTFSYDYDKELDAKLDKVEAALKDVYWYKRELFKLYLECGSLRKVEAATGIDHCSVAATVKEVKKELSKKV